MVGEEESFDSVIKCVLLFAKFLFSAASWLLKRKQLTNKYILSDKLASLGILSKTESWTLAYNEMLFKRVIWNKK